MRLQLQQKGNHSETNRDDDGDSQRRDNCRRPVTLEGLSSDLVREMRREMDDLRNAIMEKTNRSLDRMVRTTDSPFTTAVLECSVPSKFHLL